MKAKRILLVAVVAGAIIAGIGILRLPLQEVVLVMVPISLAVTLAERAA